ncbi:hypothetical protein OS493_037915 [Desmophyllum pertusum]|uniref:Transient receptor potential cation channel subfamily V member 6 n=1 Tax=Desmophyllum pertusum TaxID=174260 RepID=A0A9W9YVM1_9CNID|nr:hypothetical protein OS493_037915 [Desmophyllum pertusum]
MGNCAYKVLGIGSLSGEDHDEAWKRQTRGRLENKLYTFVDLKGLESNTEFVKIWKESGKTGFVRKLQDEKILQPYLYEHGDGKVLTAEEVKQWQNEMEPESDKQGTVESHDDSDHTPRKACWSLQHRGALGETAVHLCFLNNNSLMTEMACALLQVYPAMALDQYEGHEFYGETSVHITIVNGDLESFKLLVGRYGADVHARAQGRFFMPEDCKDKMKPETNYDGYAYYGEYPASFAACFENKDMYDYLIRKGADPNKQDTFGNAVLHLCVIHNKIDMFLHATQRKHKIRGDTFIRNNLGLTPLTLAAKLGRKEMFHEILEYQSMEYWSYGRMICSGYPLDGLDSIDKNGKSDDESALLITLNGKTSDHLDMLNSGIIYRLLEEKWKSFARGKFYRRLLFAVFYLLGFSLAIYLRPRHLDLMRIDTNDAKLRLVAEGFTVLGAIIYLVLEIKDVLISQGVQTELNTLRDAPGKSIFLVSCVLVIIALPCRYLEQQKAETIMLILAAPMAWCYLLFFCRGFGAIGPFVDMIYKMCAGDMSRFFIIYIIYLLGLAQAFSHVMKGVEGFQNEGYTIMTLMRMTFGEFDVTDKLPYKQRRLDMVRGGNVYTSVANEAILTLGP